MLFFAALVTENLQVDLMSISVVILTGTYRYNKTFKFLYSTRMMIFFNLFATIYIRTSWERDYGRV